MGDENFILQRVGSQIHPQHQVNAVNLGFIQMRSTYTLGNFYYMHKL